jgi:signal transduction histidine kinase
MTANSLFDLVQNLLAYTETGRSTKPFESVDLDALARQVVAGLDAVICASNALVEIAPLPTIQGDATGLRQLLQNLLGNAIKFQNHERPHVQVIAVQEEAWWQIRVSDNGIGIEPEYQKKIFQPLTRLHAKSAYEGSGLGLAICNKIAHLHQGTIRVESALGRGSTFVLNLPATATSEG